ncbi:MAG: hypothetical protein RQ751_10665 [Longimicrobiales bacterium]|nr:hypothetical protein [Longimicrobiales bacterium]
MHQTPSTGAPIRRTREIHSPTLRERYAAYRRAQGRELLNVIPREGVRSLLRHLRASGDASVDAARGPTPRAGRAEASVEADGGALLEWLAARCEALLPLPPFEVWVRDFQGGREEYASEPGPPLAPSAPDGSPVAVEVRSLRHAGEAWVAALAVRPAAERWVGHIRFHREGDPGAVTTGEIFREDSPVQVRERFRSFDPHTLSAFLRSALP